MKFAVTYWKMTDTSRRILQDRKIMSSVLVLTKSPKSFRDEIPPRSYITVFAIAMHFDRLYKLHNNIMGMDRLKMILLKTVIRTQ